MPQTKSLSEFNRSQSAIIEALRDSGEPLYLTRNGSSAVVVMDAGAFDRAMSFRERVRAHEMEVYDGILAGYAQCQRGQSTPADVADARLRAEKGWSR